jgi:hypothetical protein
VLRVEAMQLDAEGNLADCIQGKLGRGGGGRGGEGREGSGGGGGGQRGNTVRAVACCDKGRVHGKGVVLVLMLTVLAVLVLAVAYCLSERNHI